MKSNELYSIVESKFDNSHVLILTKYINMSIEEIYKKEMEYLLNSQKIIILYILDKPIIENVFYENFEFYCYDEEIDVYNDLNCDYEIKNCMCLK